MPVYISVIIVIGSTPCPSLTTQPHLAQPQMMVVSDITDIFVPMNAGLLVSVHESRFALQYSVLCYIFWRTPLPLCWRRAHTPRDIIEMLLDRLPHMFANNRETEPVLGPVLQSAILALQGAGGRAVVFSSALPVSGSSSLFSTTHCRIPVSVYCIILPTCSSGCL